MRLLFGRVLLCVLLAAPFPASAQNTLIKQSSDGVHRTCVYPPSFSSRGRGGVKDRSVRIGAGEPCPSVYPGEPEVAPIRIPSLATLKEEARDQTGRVCVYTYLGRDYRRPAAAGGCAMTPN